MGTGGRVLESLRVSFNELESSLGKSGHECCIRAARKIVKPHCLVYLTDRLCVYVRRYVRAEVLLCLAKKWPENK